MKNERIPPLSLAQLEHKIGCSGGSGDSGGIIFNSYGRGILNFVVTIGLFIMHLGQLLYVIGKLYCIK